MKDAIKSRLWLKDTTNVEKSANWTEKENLKMFVKFENIVEKWEKREVWGLASQEVIDTTGDIVTYEAMKDAWPEYIKYGNIREMHQPRAVWTVIDSEFIDESKATFIKVKIVDDDVWEKIKAGVYKGFSIWAKIVDAGWEIVDEKEVFVISKMKLVEISVVDRPANQEANIEGFKFISLNNESMSKKLLEKFMKGESPEELKKSETVVTEPTEPVEPVTPAEPVEPVAADPVEPTEPVETEKTEKEVELQKTLDAVLEKFNTMEEKLNKVLEFNDMLVKWLDMSFDNLSEKFEKVDAIESTLKSISAGTKSVQKTVEPNLMKSHNNEVSFKDIFGFGGRV